MTILLEDRIYDLAKREADVALRLQKSEQNSDLIQKKLMTIGFKLCVSREYKNKHGVPKDLPDLKNHVIIAHPPGKPNPFLRTNWILKIADIDMDSNRNIIMMNSMNARYSAVKQGIGLAVLPEYISSNNKHLETLFPDIEIPSVDMYFVYPQERRNSKKITVFRDFLLKHIKNSNDNYS